MSSVGQAIGGVVGGIAGFFLGGPTGLKYGAQIGLMLGGLLDQPKGPVVEGPRLEDLTVQTSTYGSVIPRVYGTVALNGNIIWLENNAIRETVTKKKSGGKGGAPKTTTRTYSYSATFAVGLCEGEMTALRRIWIGGQLFYDAGSTDADTIVASNEASDLFTFYPGSETQAPDPRMQADLGVANTPAYRGLCYIVFYDLPLADYGNSLAGAQVRVEVMQSGIIYTYPYQTFSMPSSQIWRSGAWDGTVFCAVASGNHVVAVSSDGLTWQEVALPDSATVRSGVASDGNGTLLVHGISPTGSIWRSVDHGQTWSKVHTAWQWIDHIAWSGSGFLATGSSSVVRTSADGVTWTAQTFPVGGTYFDRTPVWHAPSGHWYVVTQSGSDPRIYRSPTGATGTWSLVYTMSGDLNNFSFGCVHKGRILFNGIGTGGSGYGAMMVWSDDGVTWTKTSVPSKGYWMLSDGDNLWVGDVGTTGGCYYSADGVTGWTYYDGPNQGVNHEAFYGNFSIVAVPTGSNQAFLISKQFSTSMPVDLADVVEAECLRSGILDAGDIDTTALTQEVRGYRIASVGSIRSALEPLQGAWPFDVIPDGYHIRFQPRATSPVATIPADDLDCQPEGSPPGIQIKTSREMDTQLPRRVTINYLDVDREYDTGAQYAERLNTPAINAVVLDLPIVLTATEAAGKAEVLLYLYWLERQDVEITLPPIYNHLQPGDVITVETDEGDITLRITAISYTSDQRLEVSAKYASAAIYTPAAVGVSSSSNGATTIVRVGASDYHLIDMPRVSSAQDGPVVLAAMNGALAGWRGGVLYQSVDSGTTWLERQEFGPPGATFGTASNSIGVVEDRMVDASSVLTVELAQGELYDTTLLAMLSGANHFAYGADGRWEIIAAQKCTLVSGSTYKLQDLLRGRFGTEWAMGLHAGGDAVILLDSADIEAIPMDTAQIGASLLYRAITAGRDFSTDGNRSFTYQGVNLKPLSPILLNGSIDPGSGDWTLLWTRRSRKDTEWRDYVDAPLGEDSEQYQLDIYDSGSYSVVKRTITATAQTASYSAADQTTDFGSGQSTLYIKLYQVSATIGRGYPLTTSITR
jgi:hypothetical protein